MQYGTIKALALIEQGRYDLVDAALAQEVTDDAHPFGQACQALARALFLCAIEAWEPAATAALDAMQQASNLSRIWMQLGLLAAASTVAAHAGAAHADDTVKAEIDAIRAIGDAIGLRPGTLADAEAELASGRPDDARVPSGTQRRRRRSRRVGTPTRHARWSASPAAWTDLAGWDEAVAVCDRGLALTEPSGQLPLVWKLRGCRSHALAQLGREGEAATERAKAATEFATLADRIGDPELREWFVRQPLATRWLEDH